MKELCMFFSCRHSFFCHSDGQQQTRQQNYVRKELYERLSPAQRALLDVVEPGSGGGGSRL
jgi:hypothetical protein